MFGWNQTESKLPELTIDEAETPNGEVTSSNGQVPPSREVAVKPPEWQQPVFRQVDRPDCAETFADSITGILFDGQTLRIEFSVSRMDEAKPGAPLTGRRTPACRLVIPPSAALDLVQKMQQVGAALAKAGYAPRLANSNKAS
jgi:hypothetical protein